MTRDEAIAILRKELLCVDRDCGVEKNCGGCDLVMPSKEPILEAFKMAIKALEQEPSGDVPDTNAGDMIDRHAAIDALKNERSDWNCDYNVPVDHCIDAIYSVPSAQPERIKGHWIDAVIPNDSGGFPVIVCDKCNTFFPLQFGDGHNFCPNCGADMRGEQDDSI